MEIYTFDVVLKDRDLQDIRIRYLPHMSQKYELNFNEISLEFESYEDLKKFCLSVQSEFENLQVREKIGVR